MTAQTVNHGTEQERDRLFLEMAWEFDKIARMLPDFVPVDEEQSHFIVRALSGRMLRLTSVMMDMAQRQINPDRSIEQSRDIVMVSGLTQG